MIHIIDLFYLTRELFTMKTITYVMFLNSYMLWLISLSFSTSFLNLYLFNTTLTLTLTWRRFKSWDISSSLSSSESELSSPLLSLSSPLPSLSSFSGAGSVTSSSSSCKLSKSIPETSVNQAWKGPGRMKPKRRKHGSISFR